MDEQPSIEMQLGLFAIGEALRARAESRAAWHFLKGAGVPEETLGRAYFAALRGVIEEARAALKAQGVDESKADTIANRLLCALPVEERPGLPRSTEPN